VDGIPFFSSAYKFNSECDHQQIWHVASRCNRIGIRGFGSSAHMQIYNSHEESKEKLYAQVEDI
jgi:hypothetical protein